MKIRNILSIKKLAVLGICVSFVAGGCGKMTESSIPELEEPVALNEAYRPVEYGTIGSIQVLMATAVPRDYCNYYSAQRKHFTDICGAGRYSKCRGCACCL